MTITRLSSHVLCLAMVTSVTPGLFLDQITTVKVFITPTLFGVILPILLLIMIFGCLKILLKSSLSVLSSLYLQHVAIIHLYIINRFKYYFTTDVFDLELTILDIFILLISAIWGIILFFILPISLITSLF